MGNRTPFYYLDASGKHKQVVVLREIVRVEYSHSYRACRGCGRNTFTLECGHKAVEKTSYKYGKRMRCRDCEYAEQKRTEVPRG